MTRTALILTEATSSTGLGHYTRCMALAEILYEMGANIVLCAVQDDMILPEVPTGIKHVNYDWQRLALPEDLYGEATETTLFVDSYLASSQTYSDLSHKFIHMYCLDDYNRTAYPASAKIVNPGVGGQFVDYSNQLATCLTGIDYILLRKPFREHFELPPVAPKVQRVLITLGAEDRWNIIPQILRILAKTYANVELHVILGPGFKNRPEILALSGPRIHTHEQLSAREIRNLMLKVDVAITAGGQTTNELVRCGVPMIVLQIAENQAMNIKGWIYHNVITKACDSPSQALPFILEQMLALNEQSQRESCRYANLANLGKGIAYKACLTDTPFKTTTYQIPSKLL